MSCRSYTTPEIAPKLWCAVTEVSTGCSFNKDRGSCQSPVNFRHEQHAEQQPDVNHGLFALQGTKCTIILACLSILVVLALLAVGYSLYACYKCAHPAGR